MRRFTIDQYREMVEKFNRMTFIRKIEILRDNSDILTLASDGNWWGVKVKDKNIQEELSDNDEIFVIENEWGSSEMYDLISILGIGNTDI